MEKGRVVELRPGHVETVESSETIASTDAAWKFAAEVSGETQLDGLGCVVDEFTKARTNRIAALVKAVFFDLGQRVDVLEGRSTWNEAFDASEGSEAPRDTVVDDRAPGLSALASDLVEAIPRSAILPSPMMPDAPSALRVERVRALLGGTPLDVAASLLHGLEEQTRTVAVDGDRLALAQHLEATAKELVAGTPHRRFNEATWTGADALKEAKATIVRMRGIIEAFDVERASGRKTVSDIEAHVDTVTSERNALRATIGTLRGVLLDDGEEEEGVVGLARRRMAERAQAVALRDDAQTQVRKLTTERDFVTIALGAERGFIKATRDTLGAKPEESMGEAARRVVVDLQCARETLGIRDGELKCARAERETMRTMRDGFRDVAKELQAEANIVRGLCGHDPGETIPEGVQRVLLQRDEWQSLAGQWQAKAEEGLRLRAADLERLDDLAAIP